MGIVTRPFLIRTSAAVLLGICAWVAYTQSPQPAPPLVTEKIKDDLFVIRVNPGVGGGDVAVYLTNEGVILVDDMFDRNYDEIMGRVKMLTDQPVRYVLNTHQHDDHAGGNARMLVHAEVIAHQNVRTNMERLKQPGLPRVTFSDQIEIHLGGKEVRAFHFGRGHTGGDSIIYFPAAKVIHTGDLFLTYPPQPFIDYANGGSAIEWTSALDKALQLDFDVAIPGHGPLSDKAGIRKFRSDFETMRSRIQELVRAGKSKEEISEELITVFHWARGGLAVQQVDSLIAELR